MSIDQSDAISSQKAAVHNISIEISKPKNDDDFEDMCATIYGLVFGDPNPQKNGRRGQKQHGVDVFIQSQKEGRIGIQSKRYADGTLTFDDVKAEIQRADAGGVPITKLIVSTTSASDAPVIRRVQDLSDKRVADGKFPVQVDYWPEVCAHINRHSFLQDHYSPNAPGAMFHRIGDGQAQHTELLKNILATVQASAATNQATALPSGLESSANKFITRQLDAINEMLKCGRYKQAETAIAVLAENFSALDTHQIARWHVQRGVCRVHLHAAVGAADDFLHAFELYPDDPKMVSSRIRGLSMLDQNEEALNAGNDGLKRFPSSVDIWSGVCYVKNVLSRPVLESDVPPELVSNVDVLAALCWSAIQRNELGAAASIGRRILSVATPGIFGRTTALNAFLARALEDPVRRIYRSFNQEIIDDLRRGTLAYEPRSLMLWGNESNLSHPEDVANLAFAHVLLGQSTEAEKVLTEYTALAPLTPKMISVKLEIYREQEKPGEILALAAADPDGIESSAIMIVAELAAAEGQLPIFDAMFARIGELSDQDEAQALRVLKWVALYNSGDKEEALRLSSEATRAEQPDLQAALIASRILLAEKKSKQAERILVRLKEQITPKVRLPVRLMYVDAMLSAKLFAEAAEALEEWTPPGQFTDLHVNLLFSLIKSGQRKKAKDLLDGFPPAWSQNDDARFLAIDLANLAGDWPLLLKFGRDESDRSPDQAGAWLLRLVAEQRSSNDDGFASVLSALPVELIGTIRQLAQLANLEIRYGFAEKGLIRAYKLFRRNFENGEAAMAFMMSILNGGGDLPLIRDSIDLYKTGCSWTIDDGGGNLAHFTVDPSDMPELPIVSEFLGKDNTIARLLIGKVVGDEVKLPMNFGVARPFTVVDTSNAFARLLAITQKRAVLPNGMPNVLSMRVINADGKVDLEEMRAVMQASEDRKKHIFSSYASGPMTLGICAKALNIQPVELVMGWPQDETPMKVSFGLAEERTASQRALESAEAVVVDLPFLTELVILKSEIALSTLRKVYISSVSVQILHEIAKATKENGAFAHGSTINGELRIVEYGDDYKAYRLALFARVQAAIDTYCEVCPSYGLENVPPDFRASEKLIGDEEYETLLLAHERKAVLLSVDLNARRIAKDMLGVDSAWMQPLLAFAQANGQITSRQYSDAITTLFLSNRDHISITGTNAYMMCMQGEKTLHQGLELLRRKIAAPEADFRSSRQVVDELISEVLASGTVMDVTLQLVEYLYEAIFRHPACPSEYEGELEAFFDDVSNRLDFVDQQRSVAGMSIAAIRSAARTRLILAIKKAKEKAELPETGELVKVSVLMVTNPPRLVPSPDLLLERRAEIEQKVAI